MLFQESEVHEVATQIEKEDDLFLDFNGFSFQESA